MKVTDIRRAMALADELAAARRLRAVMEDKGDPSPRITLQLIGAPTTAVRVSGPAVLPLIDAAITDRVRRLIELGVDVPPERSPEAAVVSAAGGGSGGYPFVRPSSWGGGGGFIPGIDGPTGSGTDDLDRISQAISQAFEDRVIDGFDRPGPGVFSALAADVDRRGRVVGLLLLAAVAAVVAAIALVRAYGVTL